MSKKSRPGDGGFALGVKGGGGYPPLLDVRAKGSSAWISFSLRLRQLLALMR